MIIQHYTPSSHRHVSKDIIDAGTSNNNIKIISRGKLYKNPIFTPRKFSKWPDKFEVSMIGSDISVRRTDVSVGGWGESLIIDVEYENDSPIESLQVQKIPRVIYQTFETLDVPVGMASSIDSWRQLNPEYEHYLFDAQQRVEFIEKFFDARVLSAYLTLIPGAFKADLWRCCVLFQLGGIYVDADMICTKRLREYISSTDSFVTCRDDPMSIKFLANGFIGSTPKHPFLKKQIDEIVNNVEQQKQCYYLDISGPALLGKSVNAVCGRQIESDYVLGKNSIGQFDFTVLEHDWKTKTMKLNGESVLITEYSDKGTEMSRINNPTFYSLYQKNMVYRQIPRNIYYTTQDHLGINTYMVESFIKKNKHWSINHFTDLDTVKFFDDNSDTLNKLLGVNVGEFYRRLVNGGERSDFWRYCVLYLFGGIYSDADTICATPLDSWIVNYDLVFGVEAFLPVNDAKSFGMDKIGQIRNDRVISVCNWTIAAKPKHKFFENLIVDIVKNPVHNNVLLNTGPGRLTKHVLGYFDGEDFSKLATDNIQKDRSILFSINKFGSNQSHSNAYKNYTDPTVGIPSDVYIIHMFDGSWRTIPNKNINIINSKYSKVANMGLVKTPTGYTGICRYDPGHNKTEFMIKAGDCRSLIEMQFDSDLCLKSEVERRILNYPRLAKFEDPRYFSYNNKNYICISYIDEEFNCWIGILNDAYEFIGKVDIDEYNLVSFLGKTKNWEKNWLFFEVDSCLYFIYSTTPRYVVYKCSNFNALRFEKFIDIEWPLADNVPNNEIYFTGYVGAKTKISVAGSTAPIFIRQKNVYVYFIHTKFYESRKYNHYAVILDKNFNPIKLHKIPVISKYVPYLHFFIMNALDDGEYITISGGIDDRMVFAWKLSMSRIYKMIGVYNFPDLT